MRIVIQILSAKHYRGSLPAAALYCVYTVRGAQSVRRLRGRVLSESGCLSRVHFESTFFADKSLLGI